MPAIFLSLITSGTLKWISILTLVFGLAGSLYMKHREIVNNEKQIALQQYNINQLEQTLKDRDIYIDKLEDINRITSERVNDLILKREQLEKKLRNIESDIDRHVGAGHDRESSQILKDTIKSLGEVK